MDKLASIVSVGGWNSKLFIPQWVGENVFCLPSDQRIEVQIDQRQMIVSYRFGDNTFVSTERGIEFKTQNLSSNNLAEIDKMHKHLNDILSFTPIIAFGFNIHLIMSPEEFAGTKISDAIPRTSINELKTSSHVFSIEEVNVTKSVNTIFRKDGIIEIATNYQYSKMEDLPFEGTVFDIMKEEINRIIGYGVDF